MYFSKGTLASELQLKNFSWEVQFFYFWISSLWFLPWDLRMGSWCLGNWAPEAGGNRSAGSGEPGQATHSHGSLRYWVRNLSINPVKKQMQKTCKPCNVQSALSWGSSSLEENRVSVRRGAVPPIDEAASLRSWNSITQPQIAQKRS